MRLRLAFALVVALLVSPAAAATLSPSPLAAGIERANTAVGAAAGGQARPNVVLIMLDDMRDDDLAYMPETRQLITRQGVRFANSLAPYPLCCPARASVLTGHVVGAVIQTMVGLALVLAVALLVGFRPDANALEWLAAAGVLAMTSFALSWLSVAMGLWTRTVEAASNLPMPLMLLPFLGSGFVPVDSMPGWLRWFAEHQPFTPINETLRGLLMGTEISSNAIIAAAWCVGLTVVGFLWARRAFTATRERI